MQPLLRVGLLLLALAAGIAAGVTGAGTGIERPLAEARQAVRAQAASGQVHIVEIDARTIAALERWPWPRGHYADLIDRLHAAGAATIAFDVDFSSRSSAKGDRAMADALARAGGGVIIPTFRQRAGAGTTEWIDSLPSGPIRDHAMLAAVSIDPDTDGRVRRAPLGTITGGTPRPSLSAALASRSGTADESFPIDFAIDMDTIPRHSFIDILRGRFDPATVRGKTILVGATAIELGDRYAVPRLGVISGVVVQALAAETLLKTVPVMLGWPLPLIAAAALAVPIMVARRRWSLAVASLLAPAVLFGGSVLMADHGIDVELMPALVTVLMASAGATLLRAIRAYQRRRAVDAPSGLPNRLALLQTLGGTPAVGVAAVRLADFERLAAGLDPAQLGALMQRVAERLSLVSGAAGVYRIGDQLLAWPVSGEDAAELDQRFAALRVAMLPPVEVGGRRVDVAVSGGFADLEDGTSKAVNNAALAAEQARVAGDTWLRYGSVEKERLDLDLSLMGELDEAIDCGDVWVAYQPKLDMRTNRVTGVEALVRWQHATRGFMPPDVFIPLAERDDRIAKLTLHVLRTTIADLILWRDAGMPITGAVNLSAKLVADAAFMATLIDTIAVSGVDPRLLTIEVTESATMQDPAGAAERLSGLRALGVAISMDDYGTGQSTLSYLRRLPLDELKIDRSFVQHAHRSRSDAVLVRSTVELAHELGLRVVAEGVEDEECLAFLRSVQCDYAQGYMIGRPMAREKLSDLLAAQRLGSAA